MNKKLVKNFIFVGLVALVVCGNLLTALAVETYTWEEKASMSSARQAHNMIAADGEIYVIGGQESGIGTLQKTEKYNLQTNTWQLKASMITHRQLFGASYYNGKIYVFGGYTGTSNAPYKVEAYNVSTNTWEPKSNMQTNRFNCQTVTVGDRIYVVGGTTVSAGATFNDYVRSIKVYNPQNDTWETKAEMPYGRAYFGISTMDNKIYLVGGLLVNSEGITDTGRVDVYDTLTDTWSTIESLNVPRHRLKSVIVNGKIYALFGKDLNHNYFKSIEVYSTESNQWQLKADVSDIAYNTFGATTLNNKIYIGGGVAGAYLHTDKFFEITISETILNAPANLTATPGNAQVLLSWDLVTDADSYTVKRSTTAGGPYTTIAENITDTSYLDTSVINGTTYYYVVTAVNTAGESDPSNEASATPIAPVVNRALLNITMQESLIKEYDLSMNQVNSFIDWYNSSTGSELYTVEKFANIGPFLSRKDYLVKSKIVCFEVMEYVN